MADPIGITIYSPTGSGAQQRTDNVIFTTKYPFAKLDTQNPVSFQNISIFFNADPPYDPTGAVQVTTEVYKFAHGYDYEPTWWVLYLNNNGSNNSAGFVYGQDGSIIKATSPSTFAQLIVTVDETFISISVLKAFTLLDPTPNIIGYTVTLRFYVFTEPVLIQ